MPRIEISGIGIEYELLGTPGAHAVAINPGGRFSKDAPGIRELGEALATGGKRVLLWDRPNCGASDLCLAGGNESALQGRTLTQLIHSLNLGPTAVGGGSAGSRTSLFAAVHDPGVVSHLIPWWISGGTTSVLTLGASYYGTPAVTARLAGLAAVLELPLWDAVKNDPRKRDAFLKQDLDQFVATMERWGTSFIPSDDSPVPGMSPKDFARLTMPTLIIRGAVTDIYHPARISEWVHKLIPDSEIIDPPWPDDAPMQRLAVATRTGSSPFLDWPMLAPTILEFTSRSRYG
jgi:pimeloyl-ACP methyl ester carboxylesterase